MIKILFILTISLIFIPNSAYAKFSIHEKTIYHKFSETNPNKVLNKAGITVSKSCVNSAHSSACTKIKNKYKIKNIKRIGKQCKVTDLSITLNVVYHLPRWKNKNSASRNIINKWDRFIEKIKHHEKMHKKIHSDNFKEAYYKIKRLKTGCKNINNKINEIISYYSDLSIKENKKFDIRDKSNIPSFP